MPHSPFQIPNSKFVIPTLCAILDADVAARAGWTIRDLASAYLDGGARFLQVRAKHAPGAWLLETTAAIVERAHQAGALVIVNDRADIVRLAGADGLHVGQADLAPVAARGIAGESAIIGLSTHTTPQLDAAVTEPIDYVAIGPVFGTTTKETGYTAVGLEAVREAAVRTQARRIPLVAIGGITLEGASSVLAAGAAAVAVIGDLLATGDPAARTRAFVDRLARRV